MKRPADRKIDRLLVEAIELGLRHRPVRGEAVSALAASMSEIGLKTPITVRYFGERPAHLPAGETDDAIVLISGAHRLAAAKQLGWEKIDCFVTEDGDEIDAELWEIDENLCRLELTPTEEAEHLARRKVLWEQRQSAQIEPIESKREDGKGHRDEGFAASTAKTTGKSKSDINRAIKRTEVCQEARDLIRGTPLDTGSYLDKLLKRKLDDAAEVAQVRGDLAALADKVRRERMDREQKERARALAESKRLAKAEAIDLLLDALSPAQWDALIQLLENGGAIGAKDLREHMAPTSEAA